jgi:acetyl-CoA carboxylase biotin carboxyl carrier protein
MKPTEIKELIDFIDKSNLDEVNIETENLKISVKKNATKTIVEQVVTAAPVVSVPAAAPVARPAEIAAPAAAPAPPSPAAPAASLGKKLVEIKSPMIGTLYRSPSPDKPKFVEVGQEIKVGQTVCIIEAMKLFNEIESDVAGKVLEIKIENASPVEFDQVLFVVEVNS